MASPGISTTIILSEIILLETAIIIGVAIYLFIAVKKKSTLLNKQLTTFKNNAGVRREYLLSNIHKPKHLDEAEFSLSIEALINAEDSFYEYIIDTVYKNNPNLLETFPEEVKKLIQPVFPILAKEPKEEPNSENNADELDVDNAIDELLSDDEENNKENEAEIKNDPALDLSDTDDFSDENLVDVDAITTVEEIAEIPDELLDVTPDFTVEETPSEADENNTPQEDKPGDNK